MLITFSKAGAKRLTDAEYPRYASALDARVNAVVKTVSIDNYCRNIVCSITWAKGRRVRFVLTTRDAWAFGSRMSASGRHMCRASWEAHRDVMRALFKLDPDATIKTVFATYLGRADFEQAFPATANHNVGSDAAPRAIRDCSI